MPEIPRKISLIALTAESVGRGIAEGSWKGCLPSERSLSLSLQVSRPTLARALALLRRRGWIASEPGKGHRILEVRPRAQPKLRRTINFFFIEPVKNERSRGLLAYLEELRRHLQDAGYHLEVISLPRINEQGPEKALRKIARGRPAGLWILFSTPAGVQRWFASEGLPALVFGTNAPLVTLPSIDVDYYATGRHAAGILLKMGHRKIACFLPLPARPGDLATKAGFEAGIQGHRGDPPIGTVFQAGPDARDVCRQVDRILAPRAGYTGILIGRPLHALTIHSHLLRRGYAMPGDISLIVRDGDPYLRHLTPVPACYEENIPLITRKLARLAVQFCAGTAGPKVQTRIFQKFVRGETLGPPPSGRPIRRLPVPMGH